ncbi:UNVERIFIED_CONTAM: hypothetical protein Sindi_1258600 [Sesamum indicum]
MLHELTSWWKEARKELRSDHHKVVELRRERFVPDRDISTNNTVWYGEPEQDSWAISLTHSLSLKCTGYRRNHMIAKKKLKDLKGQFVDKEDREKALIAEVQELKNQLSEFGIEAVKAKEDAFVEDLKEGDEASYLEGVEEGRVGRITMEEHQDLFSASFLRTALDFLKSPAFQVVVEIKAANFFNSGFNTCKAQFNTLGGFAKNFEQQRLDPSLDGTFQPFPDEPAPWSKRTNSSLDEVETLK